VIVLDSCVLIAHFDTTDLWHDQAGELLRAAGAEALGASPLTLAEVLVGPARAGRLDQAQAALAQLQVDTIALGEGGPVRLAALRAGTGLKLPDCCVLLAAEQPEAAAVATFDSRLDAAARKLGFRVLGVGQERQKRP
jgi:predicted nucleic acid-binding protein